MHTDHAKYPLEYKRYIGRKLLFSIGISFFLLCTMFISLSLGAAHIPLLEVAQELFGEETNKKTASILWNIRMPQILTAVISGAGLAVAGCVMQSVLRNPLGSPFTLGISHAAAFGAALSVMVFDGGMMTSSHIGAVHISNPLFTTFSAFFFSLLTAVIIIAITKMRGSSAEIMVLSGVALGAFFTAATMILQFFADDTQLAAMVFWSFGDTARSSWQELSFIAVTTFSSLLYFQYNCWSYNAIDAGDETAKGIGIPVEKVRLIGMLTASFVTASIISFLGIIGFIGLIVPHIVRMIIGADHRFLLPASAAMGGALLLTSDTTARLILSPHILPVSVLTAFLGAPSFFWLILRNKTK